MKSILYLILILTLLSGCTQSGKDNNVVLAQSSKAHNTRPASSQAEQSELVQGNTVFALDLYSQLRTGDGNLFLSPYSISTALAMTQVGARGETLAQMNRVLHFTLPAPSLHPAFNALQLALNAREQNSEDVKKKDFQLRVTNALWGEKTYTFKAEFLDQLAENYAAGLRLLDFKNAPEPSRLIINDWVSEQTEQKIKDLLPRDSIDPMTRLVLTNAIYFKAAWLRAFQKAATQPADFHLLDGSTIQVPMMNQSARFNYLRAEGFQAAVLPYQANKLSMLVVLPDEGQFASVEKKMDAALLGSILAGLESQQVDLSLPRFKIESEFSLVKILTALGMEEAFACGTADFSGMDGTKNLCISAVLHKAYVDVNEEGTEAAAATAVVMQETSMPINPASMVIDRPFLFFIMDNQSGSILFMGRVLDPR